MKNSQITIKGLQLVDRVLTLQQNVNLGCNQEEELEAGLKRLETFKVWAENNNELQTIKHYFASKQFGYEKQFIAEELSNMFYS